VGKKRAGKGSWGAATRSGDIFAPGPPKGPPTRSCKPGAKVPAGAAEAKKKKKKKGAKNKHKSNQPAKAPRRPEIGGEKKNFFH